jgi:hypothetical protein
MTENNERTWKGNKRYIIKMDVDDPSPEQADKIYAIFDKAFDDIMPILNEDQDANFGEVTPMPSGSGWWSARKIDKVLETIQ